MSAEIDWDAAFGQAIEDAGATAFFSQRNTGVSALELLPLVTLPGFPVYIKDGNHEDQHVFCEDCLAAVQGEGKWDLVGVSDAPYVICERCEEPYTLAIIPSPAYSDLLEELNDVVEEALVARTRDDECALAGLLAMNIAAYYMEEARALGGELDVKHFIHQLSHIMIRVGWILSERS